MGVPRGNYDDVGGVAFVGKFKFIQKVADLLQHTRSVSNIPHSHEIILSLLLSRDNTSLRFPFSSVTTIPNVSHSRKSTLVKSRNL